MKVNKSKVLLGMSGGVDSSVAAVLLLKAGYEVIGGFMKNWSEGHQVVDAQAVKTECSWRTERRDAMRVAAQLGIEFYTFDFEEEYRAQVYEYMIAEYKAGRTPNPDVLCNKYMKFGLFLEKSQELGCDYVATGHYARTMIDEVGTHLLSGLDKNKDQSYFLCRLEQDQISKVLFPVGELQKADVRKIAEQNKLHVADKKDSQGICFVGKVALNDFLKDRIKPQEGNIIDTNGKILGKHQGHMYYTIGQRQGLGLAGGPWFIVERRPETNEVVVAKDEDKSLYNSELIATGITETIEGGLESKIGQKIKARIRYRQPLQSCQVTRLSNGQVQVKFDKPQRAVAPGQFIAFYRGDELLGSGIIS
ncbi:tRNA 2-thiouridine(34) synthase MnmA [Candidatus Uhrbacteria bacterium CG_4_10_14_3_um_filter_41_21]|nr:MAG: tRNA 2-thiouridine(34) synthase MnmA [Candidatus Uhrbacteria bacterium CG_4_10_14_3_um_filter_41_21]